MSLFLRPSASSPHALAVLCVLSLLSLGALPGVLSHDNGMDMSMDGAMSLSAGNMLPYFHFTPGDNLWFLGWVPRSAGAMVGTCVGLFLLGVVERWVGACRGVMEGHWRMRAEIVRADRMNARGQGSEGKRAEVGAGAGGGVRDAVMMRGVPPFIFEHDVVRGIVHAGQAALQFAFMLTVMTFQLGFILAIVVGLGVGEALFGRYASFGVHA